MHDFCLIFSFWTRWTTQKHPDAVKINTWTHALTLFLQVGGLNAHFLSPCQLMGMAAYRFRLLSIGIFQLQKRDDLPTEADMCVEFPEKWLPTFPKERAFPDNLFFVPAWDLATSAVKLQSIKVEARLASQVNGHIMRFTPSEYGNAIDGKTFSLQTKPLFAHWPTSRFRSKTAIPPWMKLVFGLMHSRGSQIVCFLHHPPRP